LEGARRIDEWSLIEKKIPSFDLIFDVDRARLVESGVELNAEQRAIVDLLNGARDVSALVDESGLGEFEVGKALYALATAGFLQRVGRATIPDPAASDLRVAEHRNLGVAFYKAGMLDEAEREFRRVVELRGSDGQAMFSLALVLLRRGQWEAAVDALRPLAAAPNARPAIHHNLAYALE